MLNHNSSDFAEFILNFIKIDTKSYLKISDNKKKLILFILINYGFPILSEVFKFFCNSSFISLNTSISSILSKIMSLTKFSLVSLDFICKIRYLLQDNFLNFSLNDYIFGLITVNKISSNSIKDKFFEFSKQLNLFLLFLFIKFGEWYYSKEEIDNKIDDISPPTRQRNIMNNICPLCINEIIEPVMLKCCGSVFCESCLLTFMKTKKYCPISKNEINTDTIIKIYD